MAFLKIDGEGKKKSLSRTAMELQIFIMVSFLRVIVHVRICYAALFARCALWYATFLALTVTRGWEDLQGWSWSPHIYCGEEGFLLYKFGGEGGGFAFTQDPQIFTIYVDQSQYYPSVFGLVNKQVRSGTSNNKT